MTFTWVIREKQLLRNQILVASNQMNMRFAVIKEPQQRGIMAGLIGNPLPLACHSGRVATCYLKETRESKRIPVSKCWLTCDLYSINRGRLPPVMPVRSMMELVLY